MSENLLTLEDIDGNPEAIVSGSDSFGGFSCDKLAMLYKGRRYILKLPDNFSDLASLYPDMKFSRYSMDPACEWLGARIFHSVGIPVQNVELYRYGGKIVAACENFIKPDEMLLNFGYLYDTWSGKLDEPVIQQLEGREAIGIEDVINIVSAKYPDSGIGSFFWEMFVVDALIGNNDRNMGNWGVLIKNDLSFSRMAPVFDNGSSFSKGWSDAYILRAMSNIEHAKNTVCNFEIPFVKDGNVITHNSYLNGNPDKNCVDAIIKIVPRMNIGAYCDDIDALAASGILSPVKADFYKKSLAWRYEDILKPALKKAKALKQEGGRCKTKATFRTMTIR